MSFHGISPTVTITTQQGNSNTAPFGFASEIPRDRFVLRQVFPNTSVFQNTHVLSKTWAQTPFRVVMNAGDLLSRKGVSGGSNQVKGAVGKMSSIYKSDGVMSGDGASGNSKYVYDSSVYTKYKGLVAKISTGSYDRASFGGSNNGAYVASRAAKRFLL
jgi:hypothetical protein